MPSDKIRHAKIEHTKAKDERDLELSNEDFMKIPDYMDEYDEILEVVQTKQGVRIKVGKKINGYSIITEMVSEGKIQLSLIICGELRRQNTWTQKRKTPPVSSVISGKECRCRAREKPA